MKAVQMENEDFVELLLNHNADVDVCDHIVSFFYLFFF
jgi:hypothetical protein